MRTCSALRNPFNYLTDPKGHCPSLTNYKIYVVFICFTSLTYPFDQVKDELTSMDQLYERWSPPLHKAPQGKLLYTLECNLHLHGMSRGSSSAATLSKSKATSFLSFSMSSALVPSLCLITRGTCDCSHIQDHPHGIGYQYCCYAFLLSISSFF